MRRLHPLAMVGLLVVAGVHHSPVAAEAVDPARTWPVKPAPKWARGAVDHGAAQGADAALKGLVTPAGFKVELVAREPQVIDPIGLTFGDDGTPYVIEWKRTAGGVRGEDYELTYNDGSKRKLHRFVKRPAEAAEASASTDPPHEQRAGSIDWLKALHDKDGDGVYDAHTIVIDDLQMPASCLIHDGWFYFTTQGSVIRRRQSEPGGKFDITETIVRGLPAFGRHQASGLAMSHDGWLFITAGDDDSHAEGSDGSRVDLYRTGGIYLCRPDGSKLQLYARGFTNPYGNVAFDEHQNIFHADGFLPGGGSFKDDERTAKAIEQWRGTRLIHVLEDADYGWRLEPGYRCCVPDVDRAAVSGERPGKTPVMMKTENGAPAGVLYFTGRAMPEPFRGWLIQPDPLRRSVTAYRVQRDKSARGNSTFEVAEQFELLKSEDKEFRPMQAVEGPDGALYIVDSRSDFTPPLTFHGEGKAGRIYRLTWSGTKDTNAPSEPRPSESGRTSEPIARGHMDAWAKVGAMSNVQLWLELNTTDLEMQKRVVNELVRRGAKNKETFIAVAKDENRPAPARIAALGAVSRMASVEEVAALAEAMAGDGELPRVAAEMLARLSPRAPSVKRETNNEPPEGGKASKVAECRALAAVMLDAEKPVEERRAALKAMSSIRAVDHFAAIQPVEQGVERMVEEIAQLVADPSAAELRADGLKLLMEVDRKRAEGYVIRVLNSGEAASVKAALAVLSESPGGAVALGNWFAEGKLDRALLPVVVEALRARAKPQAAGADGKEGAEALALLVKVYRAGLLAETDEESLKQLEAMVKSQGDSKRGRSLFLDATRTGCVLCHRHESVADRELPKEARGRTTIGPDLSRVATTRSVAAMLDAILEPGKSIPEAHRAMTITTTDGQAITGIVIDQNDKAVTIRDAATGKDLLVLRLAIASLKEKKEGVMPVDYALRLSYAELIDLLVFLRE